MTLNQKGDKMIEDNTINMSDEEIDEWYDDLAFYSWFLTREKLRRFNPRANSQGRGSNFIPPKKKKKKKKRR